MEQEYPKKIVIPYSDDEDDESLKGQIIKSKYAHVSDARTTLQAAGFWLTAADNELWNTIAAIVPEVRDDPLRWHLTIDRESETVILVKAY